MLSPCTIDELRGALGKATLKLSIVGHSEYIKKDVFIRHTFTNPNLSVINNTKSKKNYTYKIKADNKHHLGRYKRMTTLTPITPANEKEVMSI